MQKWFDTHLHLLYPDKLHYEWTAGIPALQKAFHLEDYLQEAEPTNITETLHMEVDVRENEIEEETKLIEELSKHSSKQIVGAISACRPESEDNNEFTKFAERSCANPLIHAFRRVLHTMPDELSTTSHFRKNVQLLTSQGHPFDLCVLPKQIKIAVQLVKECPNTTFVLNHGGVPNIAGNELSPWKEDIKTLAEYPNVVCKISGLIAYGDIRRWPIDDFQTIAADLRPYFDNLIEAFGWQRVLWGSDFPVCNLTKGLTAWRKVTDILVESISNDELADFAYHNARRIYRVN